MIINEFWGACFAIHGISKLSVIGTVYSQCSTTSYSSTGYSTGTDLIIIHRNCATHCWARQHQTFETSSSKLFHVGSSYSQCPDASQGYYHVLGHFASSSSLISEINISDCKLKGHSVLGHTCNPKGTVQKITVSRCSLNSILEVGTGKMEVMESNFIENSEWVGTAYMIDIYTKNANAVINESIFIECNFTKPYEDNAQFNDCVFFACNFKIENFTPNTESMPKTFGYSYLTDWKCLTNPDELSFPFSIKERIKKSMMQALIVLCWD